MVSAIRQAVRGLRPYPFWLERWCGLLRLPHIAVYVPPALGWGADKSRVFVMAPNVEKKKVGWSCRDCTKGANGPTRKPGHLNCSSDTHCRKCKESKGECHLCADADLGFKLKQWHGQRGQVVTGGAPPQSKGSGGGGGKKTSAAQRNIDELQKQVDELTKHGKDDKGGGTDQSANSKTAVEDSASLVNMLKRNLNSTAQWLRTQREEHLLAGATDEDKAKL